MPIKEVCSTISSRGKGGPGSNPPLGPGSRTNPSRGERADQTSSGKVTATEHGEGGSGIHVTGPQEHPHGGAKPQERYSPEE
jgi:hypothetical protein